jgi:hypothetical protein
MLPDALFHPLKLDAEIDAARKVSDDAAIAVLEEALTDPRARGDEKAGEYLSRLVRIFEEIGPSPEAFACLERIGDATPGLAFQVVLNAVPLRWGLGEKDVALGLLTSFHAKQALLPAGERAWAFYAPAALFLAKLFEDHERAALWVAEGLELVRERGILDETQASFGYVQDLIRGHDSTSDPLEELWNAKPARPGLPGSRTLLMPYLLEPGYEAAWEQGLLDPTMLPAHVGYRRSLEINLRLAEVDPGDSILVVPLDVPGMLAYAAATGKDPVRRQTRLDYGDSLPANHREVPWPPERNAPCWCGSTRKYKKCCGAPGFIEVESADPASFVLKVELDGVEPPVWRRFAAPSQLPMDRLHEAIQRYLGWENGFRYRFTSRGKVIISPYLEGGDLSADEARLVSCAAEPGVIFTYVYDFDDTWSHTVTVEEIRKAGDTNVLTLLDGAGERPPAQPESH